MRNLPATLGRFTARAVTWALWFLLFVGVYTILSPVCNADEPAREKKEESTLFRALGFATYGVKAGDLISTELALSTGRAYEGNPLFQNREARYVVTAALPPLLNFTTSKVHQSGHDKVALWMRIAIVAGYGYVTVHNLRVWNDVR